MRKGLSNNLSIQNLHHCIIPRDTLLEWLDEQTRYDCI